MKWKIALAAALLATSVLAVPVAAAGNTYHFSTSGLGADAF